jgi:hypothetical protein
MEKKKKAIPVFKVNTLYFPKYANFIAFLMKKLKKKRKKEIEKLSIFLFPQNQSLPSEPLCEKTFTQIQKKLSYFPLKGISCPSSEEGEENAKQTLFILKLDTPPENNFDDPWQRPMYFNSNEEERKEFGAIQAIPTIQSIYAQESISSMNPNPSEYEASYQKIKEKVFSHLDKATIEQKRSQSYLFISEWFQMKKSLFENHPLLTSQLSSIHPMNQESQREEEKFDMGPSFGAQKSDMEPNGTDSPRVKNLRSPKKKIGEDHEHEIEDTVKEKVQAKEIQRLNELLEKYQKEFEISIQEKDIQIQNQEEQIQEKEEKIENQEGIIQLKEFKIEKQQELIQEKEATIQNQEIQLQKKEGAIHEHLKKQESIIHNQAELFQEKESTIQNQDTQLEAKEALLEEQETKIYEQIQIIQSLNSDLSKQTDKISDLHQTLKRKDQDLKLIQKSEDTQNLKLTKLQQENQNLHTSLSKAKSKKSTSSKAHLQKEQSLKTLLQEILQSSQDSKEQQITKHKQAKQRLFQEMNKLEKDLDIHRSSHSALQTECSELFERKSELFDDQRDTTEEIEKQEKEIKDNHRESVGIYNQRIDELQQQLTRQGHDNDAKLKHDLKKLQKKLNLLMQRYASKIQRKNSQIADSQLIPHNLVIQ